MTTTSRTSFRSPYELPDPPGAEGWQLLYPYHLVFQPGQREAEKNAFWFCDTQHWPHVVKPFEATGPEFAFKCLSQYNTRHFLLPTTYGIRCRIHQGYAYVSPVPAAADQVGPRVPEFLKRAGYYFEHWQELLANWTNKVHGTIQELEAIRFAPLPDAQPFEEIEAGVGLDHSGALLAEYDQLIALCYRAWQYHFEFLNLGYAAYLDFFMACKGWFPEIPDLGIARMVQGVRVDLFRPDDELRGLAKLAVELGVDDILTAPDPGQHTLHALAGSQKGQAWLNAWNTARDPWFNFTSGNGLYANDVYWRDSPSLPLGYVRDYILRLRQGQVIDRDLPKLAAERERITHEYAALLEPDEKAVFQGKLALARQAYPYVENHNFYIEHWTMGVFWRKARELSRILRKADFWPAENDMFYLSREEVRDALFDYIKGWAAGSRPTGPDYWPPEIKRRRRILDALARQRPDPAFGPPPRTMSDPFGVMLYGLTPERIRSWLGELSGDGELEPTGVPASPGVAEGAARVVGSAEELPSVQEGEIIVAPITAPSWGPVLSRVRAVVTDIGGVMSHAAIICREYSLPAVTGTGSASTRIATGQWIRVDGSAGTVTILESPERQPSEREGAP